jgi:hypothetical protein
MNDDDLDRKRLRELIRLQKYGMEGQEEARAIFERMCATGEVCAPDLLPPTHGCTHRICSTDPVETAGGCRQG